VKHIVGFSGGIDSQAAARWVLNRHPAEDVILLNSDAGGNEHPITVEFIAQYSSEVHPVVVVQAEVQDMDGLAKVKIAEMGLQPTDLLTFDLMAHLKGWFPDRRTQFCTHHLKLLPQVRWIKANLHGQEFTRYTGVRRDESQNRKNRQPIEWDDCFGCPLHHPLVDWTKQMAFDFVRAHDEPINPLYLLGFNRVGCAPCINANKQDIRNWAKRFPEMIDKIRDWEMRVGKTFFRPAKKGGSIRWIDDVVRWAMTEHGGKQFSLDVLFEPAACDSDYGLCE